MTLYNEPENGVTMLDYKPLPALRGASLDSLSELIDNLSAAERGAWYTGDYIMIAALQGDIRRAEIYYKMYERREKRE